MNLKLNNCLNLRKFQEMMDKRGFFMTVFPADNVAPVWISRESYAQREEALFYATLWENEQAPYIYMTPSNRGLEFLKEKISKDGGLGGAILKELFI